MAEDGFGRLAGPGGGAGSWGPALGLAGTGRRPRRVAGPPSCVGGGGTPRWFSWWPGRVPGVFVVPGWRPRPCPAAPAVRACRPLPAAAGLSSSSRACDRPALPSPVWGRAGLASCGCRPPASVGRWRPRGGAARGELCACGGRGGRRCAAGERSPWPACGSRVCVGGGGREPP